MKMVNCGREEMYIPSPSCLSSSPCRGSGAAFHSRFATTRTSTCDFPYREPLLDMPGEEACGNNSAFLNAYYGYDEEHERTPTSRSPFPLPKLTGTSVFTRRQPPSLIFNDEKLDNCYNTSHLQYYYDGMYDEIDFDVHIINPSGCSCSERSTTENGQSTSSPQKPRHRVKKSVNFSTVHVRDYSIVIGDHPLCYSGLPLSLGWSHSEMTTHELNDFEEAKIQQTIDQCSTDPFSKKPKKLTYLERKNLLKRVTGLTEGDILRIERRRSKKTS